MKEHWNNVYASKEVDKLGWYEETPTPSIKLLSHCNINNATDTLTINGRF